MELSLCSSSWQLPKKFTIMESLIILKSSQNRLTLLFRHEKVCELSKIGKPFVEVRYCKQEQ